MVQCLESFRYTHSVRKLSPSIARFIVSSGNSVEQVGGGIGIEAERIDLDVRGMVAND